MEKDIFDLYGNKQEILHVKMPKETAKKLLMRGLQYYTSDNAQWIDDYDHIVDWLTDNKKRGLVLQGTNGVGKTLICTKILPIIFKYYLCLQSSLELIYRVRATEIENVIGKDINIGLSKILILDDVGTESISNHFGTKRDFVSELIDSCEDNSRLLIMTTNLTPKELNERYGIRTLDRLHSLTSSYTIKHESFRKK